MLQDEDNAKYRQAIKNTLEFDPQMLKRYVNFMNKPDEKTAVEQFGNGDKYFGICTVLSTLPGLPMFGHGQVEGYSEKYGMEFRRAKWDETPDEGLIRGHEWRIFPILHRRYLFADVEQFLLYDFYSPNGDVDEEVFAYSNRFNDERGLVVYHNKFSDTRGWIKSSSAYIDKASGKTLRRNLADGLGLPRVGYVIFKDFVTQLEYIRSCAEIWDNGMYFELGAYQCHAFMDWRFVGDNEWKTICDQLNGAGIPSMQAKWSEIFNVVEEVTIIAKTPAKKSAPRKTAGKVKTVKNKKEKVVAKKTKVVKVKNEKKEAATGKLVTKKAVVKPSVKKKESVAKKKHPASKKQTVEKIVSLTRTSDKKISSTEKPIVKKTARKKEIEKKSK